MNPTEKSSLRNTQTLDEYGTRDDRYLVGQRTTRLRQFQCCVISILLFMGIVLAVVVVSYSMAKPSGSNIPNEHNFLNETELNATIRAALDVGTSALRSRDLLEQRAFTLRLASPSYRHQKAVATSTRADMMARSGYASHHASIALTKSLHVLHNGSRPMDVQCETVRPLLLEAGWCVVVERRQDVRRCHFSVRYRTADGTCNNVRHPYTWGVAYTQFRRLLAPSYADGVGAPRTSVLPDAQLPSAKHVSVQMHWPLKKQDPNFTVMLAIWGQFLDHDITATALSRGAAGDPIACCGTDPMHPECFPVIDHERTGHNWTTCSEFVRSAPVASENCCLGPRQQLNQASAYIDASVVYGSDEKVMRRLRTLSGGELRMLRLYDGRELLPVSDDALDGCNRALMNRDGKYCFTSGDARANENLHLTSMHLIWARQHNFLARELNMRNPHWSDEHVFQEVRRIVAAQLQHITYTEFLPGVLGENTMRNLQLQPLQEGYFMHYDEHLNASIANSFATAVFRFAHSMIPGLMQILRNDTSSPEYVHMHDMLFDPYRLYVPGELDGALRGAMRTPLEPADAHFTTELTTHLFAEPNMSVISTPTSANSSVSAATTAVAHSCGAGLDLVALNVQRGRDHGLPGYTAWLQYCGGRRPRTFADLNAYMDRNSVQRLQHLYAHVDDVDLYTGAMSETSVDGSLLGPTANCLVADQFHRLRYADRYWYESPAAKHAFTERQLQQIRRTSLAAVICDNADHIEKVPMLAMRREHEVTNTLVMCTSLPRVDLDLWTEQATPPPL